MYCKDSRRRGYPVVSFTFCGYVFRPRKAFNKAEGWAFTRFLPAVDPGKLASMSRKVDDTSAHDSDTERPRTWREPGCPGLAQLLHGVLSEHGDSVVLACRSPPDALGKMEVQAAGTR